MITYAQMEKYDKICESNPNHAKFINKAKVDKLLTENGKVVGVNYVKGGKEF